MAHGFRKSNSLLFMSRTILLCRSRSDEALTFRFFAVAMEIQRCRRVISVARHSQKKKRRLISAVSILRNPTLQIDVSPGQNRVRPFLHRTRIKVDNVRLSCGYFQFCTDNNAVVLQTVGRFKRFYRCSVSFGDAGQAIAGFDHVKSLGLAGGRCILL